MNQDVLREAVSDVSKCETRFELTRELRRLAKLRPDIVKVESPPNDYDPVAFCVIGADNVRFYTYLKRPNASKAVDPDRRFSIIQKLKSHLSSGSPTATVSSPEARRTKQEIASEMIEKIVANGEAKGGESRDWWAKKLEEEGFKVSAKTVSRCPAFKSLDGSRKEEAFRRSEVMKMRGQLYEYN